MRGTKSAGRFCLSARCPTRGRGPFDTAGGMKRHLATCAVYAEDLKNQAEKRERIKRQKIEADELEREREAANGRGLEPAAMNEYTDVRVTHNF